MTFASKFWRGLADDATCACLLLHTLHPSHPVLYLTAPRAFFLPVPFFPPPAALPISPPSFEILGEQWDCPLHSRPEPQDQSLPAEITHILWPGQSYCGDLGC